MNANWKFNKLLVLSGCILAACNSADKRPSGVPAATDSLLADIRLQEAGGLRADGHTFITVSPEATKTYTLVLPARVVPDPDKVHRISLLFSGRIVSVNVHREQEKVKKGQVLLEVYSPEILTAQREYLSLVGQSGHAATLARKRLQLLGLDEALIRQIEKTGIVLEQIPVYSPLNGYIRWKADTPSGSDIQAENPPAATDPMGMGAAAPSAQPASPGSAPSGMAALSPGQNFSKGQALLEIVEFGTPWLSIDFQENLPLQRGDLVRLQDGRSLPIRSIGAQTGNFSNALAILPGDQHYFIGELLQVSVPVSARGNWLPRKAVLSTGTGHLVFLKEGPQLVPFRVNTGLQTDSFIQIKAPLPSGEVVANAWFLLEDDQNIQP